MTLVIESLQNNTLCELKNDQIEANSSQNLQEHLSFLTSKLNDTAYNNSLADQLFKNTINIEQTQTSSIYKDVIFKFLKETIEKNYLTLGFEKYVNFLSNIDTTSQVYSLNEVENNINKFLFYYSDVDFENGEENALEKDLYELILQNRDNEKFVLILSNRIILKEIRTPLAAQLLKTLGKIIHPPTKQARLWLLERCLKCDDVYIRDGAIIGLSYLNDIHSIPYIEKAIEKEESKVLKDTLTRVLTRMKGKS